MCEGHPRVRLERRLRRVRGDESGAVQRPILPVDGVGDEAVQPVGPGHARRERVDVATDEEVVAAVRDDDVRAFELLIDLDRVEQRRPKLPRQRVARLGDGDADAAVELPPMCGLRIVALTLRSGDVRLEEQVRLARRGVLEEPRIPEGVDHSPRFRLGLVPVAVRGQQGLVGPRPRELGAVGGRGQRAAVRDRDPLGVRHLVGALVAGGSVVEVEVPVVVQRRSGPLALAERAAVEHRSGVAPLRSVRGVETPDLRHVVSLPG